MISRLFIFLLLLVLVSCSVKFRYSGELSQELLKDAFGSCVRGSRCLYCARFLREGKTYLLTQYDGCVRACFKQLVACDAKKSALEEVLKK